jgi:hypothetical protein
MKIVSLQVFDWGTTHPGASPPAQSTAIVVFAHVGRCGHRRTERSQQKSELQFRLTNLAIIYVRRDTGTWKPREFAI